MPYRLFYWALRGRGEQIRLLLNELEQDYEDVLLRKGSGLVDAPGRGLAGRQGNSPLRIPYRPALGYAVTLTKCAA